MRRLVCGVELSSDDTVRRLLSLLFEGVFLKDAFVWLEESIVRLWSPGEGDVFVKLLSQSEAGVRMPADKAPLIFLSISLRGITATQRFLYDVCLILFSQSFFILSSSIPYFFSLITVGTLQCFGKRHLRFLFHNSSFGKALLGPWELVMFILHYSFTVSWHIWPFWCQEWQR